MSDDENNQAAEGPPPPRFTPKRLDELAEALEHIARKEVVGIRHPFNMLFEAANALRESAGIAQLHENLAFVLMQVDRYLADRIPNTGSPGWCADCGAPQFITPSGTTCVNGHGGAESLAKKPERWP